LGDAKEDYFSAAERGSDPLCAQILLSASLVAIIFYVSFSPVVGPVVIAKFALIASLPRIKERKITCCRGLVADVTIQFWPSRRDICRGNRFHYSVAMLKSEKLESGKSPLLIEKGFVFT
jgi:hypothetical protein